MAAGCTNGYVRVQDNGSWSSLKCELKILEAKNVELNPSSELFVRCYLAGGNNTKVPINTREISSMSDKLHWGECFSLECSGDYNLIETLRQQDVVFELRRRSETRSVFNKLKSSNLVGRAEVAWKTVFESTDMKIEQWLPLALKGASVAEGFKLPTIRIGMTIQVSTMKEKEGQKESSRRRRSLGECGCKYGACCCVDDDLLLVLGACMFEAL
uniref:C2 domain-containing protein n=1 Tax=Kalanchoe fedtschenkoi TaxID=63787 RepID=A0A7N0VFX4_KALFE